MSNPNRNDSIDAMIACADDFYHFGWLAGTTGNMSCRIDDETLLITAAGQHLRGLEADDFVDVDFDGQPTDGGDPSGDTDTHLAIYKNVDDANAVYHIHHLEAALCSDRDHKRGFTHLHEIQMISALGIDGDGEDLTVDFPIVESSYETLPGAIADVLADDPPDVPCINVKNHGLYVWGTDPGAARRHVEACAYLFAYSWERPMNPKKSSSISGFGM